MLLFYQIFYKRIKNTIIDNFFLILNFIFTSVRRAFKLILGIDKNCMCYDKTGDIFRCIISKINVFNFIQF